VDDAVFLAQVEELLRDLVHEDVVVTTVQPADGRPWPRTEVSFRFADPPASWRGPIIGSAYLPLAEEWRYASGYEEPADYAQLAADAVESAAYRLAHPRPPSLPLTSRQIDERWAWLIERLALNGPVQQVGPGRLVVSKENGTSFTVIVAPEQWAPIAEPIDHDSDDPQDFNQFHPDETFLVFYEDNLEWSVRPELPPVRWGAELKREVRAAKARGETNFGWFALGPGGERFYLSDTDDDDE
jgi:hypothetical protein